MLKYYHLVSYILLHSGFLSENLREKKTVCKMIKEFEKCDNQMRFSVLSATKYDAHELTLEKQFNTS